MTKEGSHSHAGQPYDTNASSYSCGFLTAKNLKVLLNDETRWLSIVSISKLTYNCKTSPHRGHIHTIKCIMKNLKNSPFTPGFFKSAHRKINLWSSSCFGDRREYHEKYWQNLAGTKSFAVTSKFFYWKNTWLFDSKKKCIKSNFWDNAVKNYVFLLPISMYIKAISMYYVTQGKYNTWLISVMLNH